MEQHEYDSVQQMKGSMSQLRCPDPSAFERAQYMKAVRGVQHVMVTSREAWRILTGD
jgi:dihydroorotate dehydrogenase (fumarate)